MNANLFTFSVMAMGSIVSVIILIALFNLKNDFKTPGYVIGFICILIGIAGQVFRNIYYLNTGIAPVDTDLPIWVFKDIGVFIVALTYILSTKRTT